MTLLIIATGVTTRFSDEWLLWTSFAVSIAMFFMLFFLHKAQHIGDKATHLKLDELIRALEPARNELTEAEKKSESGIEALRQADELDETKREAR